MESRSGHVYSVTLIPSRLDTISVQYGQQPDSYAPYSSLFSIDTDTDADAEVTVNGKKVTVGELFARLSEPHNVSATVNPCAERYGLSLKTEFVDEDALVPNS